MKTKCSFCKYNLWSNVYKRNCYPFQKTKKNKYTGVTYYFDGRMCEKEELNANGDCLYYKDGFIIGVVKAIKKYFKGQ